MNVSSRRKRRTLGVIDNPTVPLASEGLNFARIRTGERLMPKSVPVIGVGLSNHSVKTNKKKSGVSVKKLLVLTLLTLLGVLLFTFPVFSCTFTWLQPTTYTTGAPIPAGGIEGFRSVEQKSQEIW
jgi:hypothetical protein